MILYVMTFNVYTLKFDKKFRLLIFIPSAGIHAYSPYLCARKSHKGCPTERAEIIPIEPDPGNAGEGKRRYFETEISISMSRRRCTFRLLTETTNFGSA